MQRTVCSFLIMVVLFVSSALPAKAEDSVDGSFIWLPLIQTPQAPPFCIMWTDDNFLWINIYGQIGEEGLYIYNHVFSTPLVYHAGDEGKHLIGQKELAPAMAVTWLEGHVGYQTRCSVGEAFTPSIVGDGPVVPASSPTTWLDFATVAEWSAVPPTYYTLTCLFLGDHDLSVDALIFEESTGKETIINWHTDHTGVLLGWIDCSESEHYEIKPGETVLEVRFTTEDSEIVVSAGEFFHFVLLPLIEG